MPMANQIAFALEQIAASSAEEVDAALVRLESDNPHVRTQLSAAINLLASSAEQTAFWVAVCSGYRRADVEG